jgi:hypothetical protein
MSTLVQKNIKIHKVKSPEEKAAGICRMRKVGNKRMGGEDLPAKNKRKRFCDALCNAVQLP